MVAWTCHWRRGPSFFLGGCEWKALPPQPEMAQSNPWGSRAHSNNPRPYRAFWTWWIELSWCFTADNACISGRSWTMYNKSSSAWASASSLVKRLRMWTLRLCFRRILYFEQIFFCFFFFVVVVVFFYKDPLLNRSRVFLVRHFVCCVAVKLRKGDVTSMP